MDTALMAAVVNDGDGDDGGDADDDGDVDGGGDDDDE